MKEHPILFSTPMVESILPGRKTKTRRTRGLEKLNAEGWVYSHCSTDKDIDFPFPADAKKPNDPWYLFHPSNGNHKSWIIQCPYGKKGDVLWVRETVSQFSIGGIYSYKADNDPEDKGTKWRPSIHMPKAACRIRLRITDIRIERLHDITEEDAIAEGIYQYDSKRYNVAEGWVNCYKDYVDSDNAFSNPILSFLSLWQSINGIESMLANPWVWVIEFERI